MYAIVKTGGKQYRVMVGQELNVEKLPEAIGNPVHFYQVMMIADGEDVKIGAPFIDKAEVIAEVLDHDRAKTIEILKFKRRKHHMKRQGHRQYFTKVKITDIKA